MEDTCTPIQLQVVVKLSFRFGKTANERQNSFIFARVNAFSSRAGLDRCFEPVTLGSPVKGVLELTGSSYESAQLVGRHSPNLHPNAFLDYLSSYLMLTFNPSTR